MLKSETRTKEVYNAILEDAQVYFENYNIYEDRIAVIWDHGNWWVEFDDEDEDRIRTFDVVDIEDKFGNEIFGFEEV